MKRGTCSITLTFEIEFADDGNEADIKAIRSDNHLVEMASEAFIVDALPEALWDQIKADAWEDAVDEGTPMWQAQQAEADEGEFCGAVP
jgi:hypothetical protein